jgi:tagaturonate reductase
MATVKELSYRRRSDVSPFTFQNSQRFRNPLMKQRNIPLLLKYYQKFSQVPEYMALGFAAFLLFMKCYKNSKQTFVGAANGIQYSVQDDHARYFAEKWTNEDASETVEQILRDEQIWGTDLSLLNGFADAVKKNVLLLMQYGQNP